jgi:hypothetical protein
VQLRQAAHQGQAEPQPALRAAHGTLYLGEHLEDARQHVRRDADACVPHPEQDFTRSLRPFTSRLHGQPNAAAVFGVLGGVVEQVRHDLGQPSAIAFYPHGLLREGNFQVVLAGVDEGAADFDGPRYDGRQVHRSSCKLILPRLMRDKSSKSSTTATLPCLPVKGRACPLHLVLCSI